VYVYNISGIVINFQKTK